MMRRIRQTIRGCTDLPHVGEHPGTMWLLMFIAMGALAGAKGGLLGCLAGGAIMAVFMGTIYLCGAYSRAELSDRLEVERVKAEQTNQRGKDFADAVAAMDEYFYGISAGGEPHYPQWAADLLKGKRIQTEKGGKYD